MESRTGVVAKAKQYSWKRMEASLIKYYKGSENGREKFEVKQCMVYFQYVAMSSRSLTFFCALCVITNIIKWDILEASK